MKGVFILHNVCYAPYLDVAFFLVESEGWLIAFCSCLTVVAFLPLTNCADEEKIVLFPISLYGDLPLVSLANDIPTNFQLNLLFISPSETEVSLGNSTE